MLNHPIFENIFFKEIEDHEYGEHAFEMTFIYNDKSKEPKVYLIFPVEFTIGFTVYCKTTNEWIVGYAEENHVFHTEVEVQDYINTPERVRQELLFESFLDLVVSVWSREGLIFDRPC